MSETLLLCRTGELAGLACPVVDAGTLLGRSPPCRPVLADPQVSREHARIRRGDDGTLRLEDLGSSNGTFLNGDRLRPGAGEALKHLDVVRLGGELELALIDLDCVSAAEVVAAQLVGGDGVPIPLHLGVNVVGADPGCDLVLEAGEVAPRHAELDLESGGLVLVRSPGAARLVRNRRDVQVALLEDGDRIELGGASFRVDVFRGRAAATGDDAAAVTWQELEPVSDGSPPDGSPPDGPSPGGPPPPPVPAPAALASAAGTRESLAGLAVTESSSTRELANVDEAVRRARERHERLLARDRDSAAREWDVTTGTGQRPEGVAVSSATTRPSRRGRERAAAAAAPRREAVARVRFRLPSERSERVALLREGTHVVGRDPACPLHVPDRSVSREHAEIAVRPDGLVVRDLGSTNGTFVSDRRVETARLAFGQAARLGRIDIRFERS